MMACTGSGRWGNLPAGEAFVAPVEESVEGIVVVDGSMSPLGLLAEPIKLTIQRGKVIKIEGGREAEELSRFLEELSDPMLTGLGSWALAPMIRHVSQAIFWKMKRLFAPCTLLWV